MKQKILIIIFNIIAFNLFSQGLSQMVYKETECTIKTITGDLNGSLTIPNNSITSPLVIIIAGSGPTDRNCNSTLGIQTNAYKMLAEDFAKNNISTFRFDKRGIGKSQAAMTSEIDLRFETYINDVVSIISFFRVDKRFSEIIILGHSEGSLIGMIAAEKTLVSEFISIAGIGQSADKILQSQLKTKLPLNLLFESNQILDSLRVGKLVSNVNPQLQAIYRPSVQPYMISWFKYNPSNEIQKLKIPVLIIQGTTDLQVSIDESKLLSSSKPDATLAIIDNMNHVLKESDSNTQNNMATYNNPTLPLKAGLADLIVNFIKNKK